MKTRIGLAVALMSVMTVSAFAQSAAGSWKGKLNLKMELPPMQDPKMKQMVEQQLAAVKNIVVNLTMNANKTYTLKATGAPANMGGDQTDNGVWSQSGKTITITSKKKGKNGKSDNKPQKMTISADGKTMIMDLPGMGGKSGGNITFKR